MTDKVAEAPVFDFDEMSWGDSKQIMILGEKLKAASGDTAMSLFADLEKAVSPYIVSVPRSWLVKRAPDPVDYSQPGALEWLRRSRFYELLGLITAEIVKAEDDAGESLPLSK